MTICVFPPWNTRLTRPDDLLVDRLHGTRFDVIDFISDCMEPKPKEPNEAFGIRLQITDSVYCQKSIRHRVGFQHKQNKGTEIQSAEITTFHEFFIIVFACKYMLDYYLAFSV